MKSLGVHGCFVATDGLKVSYYKYTVGQEATHILKYYYFIQLLYFVVYNSTPYFLTKKS